MGRRLKAWARYRDRRELGLHLKQPLGIAVEHFYPILLAQRHVLHPRSAWHILDVGPIYGEQDAIDAHLLNAAQQRRVGKMAARGDVEVLAKYIAERYRINARRREMHEGVVDTPHQERQTLTEMPDDDLEGRKFIEYTREHQPEPRCRSLDGEAPAGA